MLTDKYGQVAEKYQYDIWGKAYEGRFKYEFPRCGNGRNDNVYGFTGQRYQPELGVYSFAYRDYNPRTMRWLTEDPVKDGLNWYRYCYSDPINWIDRLGLKIVVDPVATKDQVDDYNEAIGQITQTERGKELVSNLEESKETVVVSINDSKTDNYNPATNKVQWDANTGLVTKDNEVQPPSIALGHELGHAEQDIKGELPSEPTEEQVAQIENDNVSKTETPIAEELGLPTRSDYLDVNKDNPSIETKGPTTTEPKDNFLDNRNIYDTFPENAARFANNPFTEEGNAKQ